MNAITVARLVCIRITILAARAIAKIPSKFMRTVKFKSGRIGKVQFSVFDDGVIKASTRGLPDIMIVPRFGRFAACVCLSSIRSNTYFDTSARAAYQQAVATSWSK